MEIQWRKYSTCIIVPLWKNVISTFLKYSELEMKEWSIRNFVFLLNFFIVPDNPRSLTHDVSTYISSRNCHLLDYTLRKRYLEHHMKRRPTPPNSRGRPCPASALSAFIGSRPSAPQNHSGSLCLSIGSVGGVIL